MVRRKAVFYILFTLMIAGRCLEVATKKPAGAQWQGYGGPLAKKIWLVIELLRSVPLYCVLTPGF